MVSRLSVAFLLLAVIAACHAVARPNNLIVGSRVPGDSLIQHELVEKKSSLLQIVKLRKTFTGNNFNKITQVRFLDQNKHGNGATAMILNGGPGNHFVTVEFKSIRGHGIKFEVEIYGN